jgi:hypothetical protein
LREIRGEVGLQSDRVQGNEGFILYASEETTLGRRSDEGVEGRLEVLGRWIWESKLAAVADKCRWGVYLKCRTAWLGYGFVDMRLGKWRREKLVPIAWGECVDTSLSTLLLPVDM